MLTIQKRFENITHTFLPGFIYFPNIYAIMQNSSLIYSKHALLTPLRSWRELPGNATSVSKGHGLEYMMRFMVKYNEVVEDRLGTALHIDQA